MSGDRFSFGSSWAPFVFLALKIDHNLCFARSVHPDSVSLTGKQLMLHVAELVPRHPNRTKKQEPASTSSNAGPSKSGKGGKKKR
ncbi:hypothetical protein WN944_025252 [Citrus x changshan-huyou]|uniref:Uncharacterized protein n=1 Tax=Citrus x changshan-huyou TaxID=2935761 RepID=A0AAP0LU11_9ROSI